MKKTIMLAAAILTLNAVSTMTFANTSSTRIDCELTTFTEEAEIKTLKQFSVEYEDMSQEPENQVEWAFEELHYTFEGRKLVIGVSGMMVNKLPTGFSLIIADSSTNYVARTDSGLTQVDLTMSIPVRKDLFRDINLTCKVVN